MDLRPIIGTIAQFAAWSGGPVGPHAVGQEQAVWPATSLVVDEPGVLAVVALYGDLGEAGGGIRDLDPAPEDQSDLPIDVGRAIDLRSFDWPFEEATDLPVNLLR